MGVYTYKVTIIADSANLINSNYSKGMSLAIMGQQKSTMPMYATRH